MAKKQFIIWLVQAGLIVALGSLEFVESSSAGEEDSFFKHIAVQVFNHRLVISIILGLTLVIINGWEGLYAPRRWARDVRQKAMETLLLELLDDDKNNYRITIFKQANFFRRLKIFVILTWRSLKAKRQGGKFAFPKWGRYIIVWHRLGTEHAKSKTFFCCSRHTQRDSQGVAGAVMQSLSDIAADNLPDIEDLDLETVDLKNLRSPATRKVNEYMQKGYMNDFDTLKRLHKRARHIYGNVLNDLQGEPKGVLVIDSFLPESFLNDHVTERLSHYVTIIGTTM